MIFTKESFKIDIKKFHPLVSVQVGPDPNIVQLDPQHC